ncbi:MAG: hypothetical protein ABSA85_11205 [Terracidiphilus sp.]
MAAKQTSSRHNGEHGATRQPTELPAAAAKPATGPLSTSETPALH